MMASKPSMALSCTRGQLNASKHNTLRYANGPRADQQCRVAVWGQEGQEGEGKRAQLVKAQLNHLHQINKRRQHNHMWTPLPDVFPAC